MVRIVVPLVKGWVEFLVQNLGAAQYRLQELKLYGRTADALPVCWARKINSGVNSKIWYGWALGNNIYLPSLFSLLFVVVTVALEKDFINK